MTDNKRSNEDQIKKLYKSRKDRMIDGVCAGFSDFIGVDVTLVRILWFVSIFIQGIGLLAYILMMIFVPVNPAHANLKDEEKTRRNPAVLWGAILIFLGFFLLAGHWNLHLPSISLGPLHTFPGWGYSWDRVWPLGLVILGIVYIVVVLQRDKKDNDQKVKDKKSVETAHHRKLYRTMDDKVLGGVCGGIARYFNIDSTLVRIGFALLALITHLFMWIFVYVLFLIIVPYEPIVKTNSGEGVC